MGIGIYQWSFMEKYLKAEFKSFKGVKLVELGNQHIRLSLRNKFGLKNKVSKHFLKSLGFEHISLDKNGKDGALKVNLSKPIKDSFINYFDVLTNIGTTEHVVPYKNQYQCFKNVHNLVHKGGIFIHIVPEYNSFVQHSFIHYSIDFFKDLSISNNYEIIFCEGIAKSGRKDGINVCCCLKKKDNNYFNMDKTIFFNNLYVGKKNMKTVTKKIEEFSMKLDASGKGISGTLKKSGRREPCFMWVIEKEAHGDLGMDIGANIGYTTLRMCKQMNRVIAIEPDKRTSDLLEKNIKRNGFQDKTQILKQAVSDKVGSTKIYLAKHPNLITLCDQKEKKHQHKIKTIETITLDSLGVSPNFVKMDVEGYEVEILRGGMDTWKNTENCKILIEVHPQFYSEDHSFEEVLKSMVELGFRFKYVISAACECPDMFKEKGYKPFKVKSLGRWERGIFSDISTDDAINFSSYKHKQKVKGKKTSNKIVRAILLVKGN